MLSGPLSKGHVQPMTFVLGHPGYVRSVPTGTSARFIKGDQILSSENPRQSSTGKSLTSSLRLAVDEFDEAIDQVFDLLRGRQWVDYIFYWASALGDHGLLWTILATLKALRPGKLSERSAIRAVVATGTQSVVVNLGLKSIFRRHRPPNDNDHPLHVRVPMTSSFPSGHATAAFCAANLLAEGDNLWLLYYSLATVVALSRIHVRMHHASDVLGGIAIGLLLGRIARKVAPLAPLSSTIK